MKLKNQLEKALNEDNLAYQAVMEAWGVDAFREAELGSKKGKMSASLTKREETKIAVGIAKGKVLEFAKEHNIESTSGKHYIVKNMLSDYFR